MSQRKYGEIIKTLSVLGFTELEATVYSYLVENSPATAYRVAQEIGKPVANTYKAVQSLYQKEAVLIDETQNRLCQAVPPSEVLERLRNSFLDRHQRAEDALAELKPAINNEKIFALQTRGQLFERCRKLIEQAETIVLIDAFPGAVEIIAPWIAEAAARGVTVVLQAYEQTAVENVEIVMFQPAEKMLDRWQGAWLIVVVDGAEYVFAFLSDDGNSVYNAIWCGNAFLSLPQHCNLAHSFRASIVEKMVKSEASLDELKAELARTEKWLTMGTRGYDKLKAEFSKRD